VSLQAFFRAPLQLMLRDASNMGNAVELLTEFNFEQAQQFASEIEQYNSDRKDLDKQITKEAFLQIEENKEQERFTSVVFQENWHKGY
jgi:single-stranded-DNA-specific exonuclease